MSARTLLMSAGQPVRRNRAWTYCVKGSGRAGAAAVLTPEGQVALVASSAPGQRLRGIRPGTRLAALRRSAKRIGGGIWVGRKGKTRVAYLVRGKRVRTVAVAGPRARGRRALREYLRLLPTTGMKARKAVVAKQSSAPITARNATPLVQRHHPGANPFYCSLEL
jgi:hypothetical protein